MTMKTTAWMFPVRKILAFRMSSASYHGFLSSIVSATSLARSPPRGSRSIGERNHTESGALLTACGSRTWGRREALEDLWPQSLSGDTPVEDTDSGSPDRSLKSLCDSWDEDERNWHKRTLQLAHHMAGLGPVRGEDLTSPTPGQHARCARPRRIL